MPETVLAHSGISTLQFTCLTDVYPDLQRQRMRRGDDRTHIFPWGTKTAKLGCRPHAYGIGYWAKVNYACRTNGKAQLKVSICIYKPCTLRICVCDTDGRTNGLKG